MPSPTSTSHTCAKCLAGRHVRCHDASTCACTICHPAKRKRTRREQRSEGGKPDESRMGWMRMQNVEEFKT